MHLSRPWPVLKGLLVTLLLSNAVYAIDLDISDERASKEFIFTINPPRLPVMWLTSYTPPR